MDLVGLASGIFAASIWGGMYVVSKVVLDIIPPFTLLTIRLLIGILTLVPFIIKSGGIKFSREQWLKVLGVGCVGYGISLGFQFIGTKLSTASNGALVTSATPAFVLLFAFWILGERITRNRLLSLILATMGVIIVLDPRSAQISPEFFLGNINLLGAALTWALYSVLIRFATRGLPVLQVSLVSFVGGLPLSILAAIFEIGSQEIGAITYGVFFGILYLGIVATGLAMFLWNTAFARLTAGLASLTFFAQPVVGAGLGAITLGEKITPSFLIGGLLIGIGLLLASVNKNSPLSDGVK